MILDEAGLTWRYESTEAVNDTGGLMRLYRCVEHPRITKIVQRPHRDEPWVERYYVQGLANWWRMPRNALEALRENPA